MELLDLPEELLLEVLGRAMRPAGSFGDYRVGRIDTLGRLFTLRAVCRRFRALSVRLPLRIDSCGTAMVARLKTALEGKRAGQVSLAVSGGVESTINTFVTCAATLAPSLVTELSMIGVFDTLPLVPKFTNLRTLAIRLPYYRPHADLHKLIAVFKSATKLKRVVFRGLDLVDTDVVGRTAVAHARALTHLVTHSCAVDFTDGDHVRPTMRELFCDQIRVLPLRIGATFPNLEYLMLHFSMYVNRPVVPLLVASIRPLRDRLLGAEFTVDIEIAKLLDLALLVTFLKSCPRAAARVALVRPDSVEIEMFSKAQQ